MSQSNRKTKRSPLSNLFFIFFLLPVGGFALYFAAQKWLVLPPTVDELLCPVCTAAKIYGLTVIFLVLAIATLALTFIAIAAITSWLDRYGLLEDIITYVLLLALVPASLAIAYFLFRFPAGWWRTWVHTALCGSC